MRTTLRLDPTLMSQVKKLASKKGKTLTKFMEEALRAALGQGGARRPRRPLKFKMSKCGGLRPGVNLDDTSSLFDDEFRTPS
ncbi:MAG: ribbon-helix-helix protein, CopG family [Planctomycetota bacterium]